MKELHITSTEAGAQNNVTPIVVEALNSTDGDICITFDAGEYHFYKEGAHCVFLAPANNGHSVKSIAFPIIQKENVTIDGGGALFVFHAGVFPFVLQNSKNVILKHFCMDTYYSPVAAGVIREKGERGFSMTFAEGTAPFMTDQGHLIFQTEAGEVSTADTRLSTHSLDVLCIKYLFAGDTTARMTELAAKYMHTDAEVLEDRRTVRFTYRSSTQIPCPYKVGERVCLNLAEGRDTALFFLDEAVDTKISDVTVYHGVGMGVVAQLSHNLEVDRLCSDDSRHRDGLSITADVFHFSNCTGRFEIHDCDFANSLDDMLNSHGFYSVVKTFDGQSLGVFWEHLPHAFYQPYRKGDRVRLIDPATSEIVTYATVAADGTVAGGEGRWLSVPLCDIDEGDAICEGLLVELFEKMPYLHVHHNRFGYFPNLRLSGGGGILLEHNHLYHCSHAILTHDLWHYWYESGRCSDMTVRSNFFEDCNGMEGKPNMCICINLPEEWEALSPRIHDRITIENNTFEGEYRHAIFARGVNALTLRGNSICGHTEKSAGMLVDVL